MTNIPKILHRIWLGPNPVPPEYEEYWAGWQDKHPGWQYHTWTDDDIPPLPDETQYHKSPNFAMRSDFVRYEVLRQHGGVYVDSDFECIKNIDALIENVRFMTGWETNGKFLAGGLFACTPQHPLTDVLSSDVGRNVRDVERNCHSDGFYYAPHGINYPTEHFAGTFKQSAQSGPLYFTNKVFDWLIEKGFYDVDTRRVAEPRESGVRLCDEITFYPWKPWNDGIRLDRDLTYAIHHYAGSWVDV